MANPAKRAGSHWNSGRLPTRAGGLPQRRQEHSARENFRGPSEGRAPYAFTTLNPVVGVVGLGGYRRATVADIPGLIEGAHNNKGLGHEFLRHIERCKLLLFVIDMAGSEGRDPIEDFRTLRRELKLYDPALAARPFAVVANKMDLPEAADHLREFKAKFRKATVMPVCANKGEGVERVRELFARVLAPETS